MAPKVVKKKLDKKVVKPTLLAQGDDASNESLEPAEEAPLIPVDQLKLTEEELNKEETIIFSAGNPSFKEEFVEFSFKDKEYKTVSNFPDTIRVYSQSGNYIHNSLLSKEDESEEAAPKEQKRMNKFNFCDRAVQTNNLPLRDQISQKDAPATEQIQLNATQWSISEAYDQKLKHATEDSKHGVTNTAVKKNITKDDTFVFTTRILERMINQNKYCDVVIDFRYYDNPFDEFSETGSLLPLWKLTFRKMKGFNITKLCWNPRYSDMFAAAFGTNEFLNEEKGCICVFSLKCTFDAEKVYPIESSVQCMDFNTNSPSLLVAGFSDGRVVVFDLCSKKYRPILSSQCCVLQHNDAVAQVKWLADNIHGLKNFCSVSYDGRIVNWCISKGELIPKDILTLQNKDCITYGFEGALLDIVSCGTTISFNEDNMDLFLVGTQEGVIHKCSTLYSQLFLSKYEEHTTAVYNIEWNPYHPRVFLSCSSDWTIRIWDHKQQSSVYVFDLFNEVKTATWAPFSSTLFAAITKDGKVHVFDLMLNRQLPICSLVVHGPKKHTVLTSVAFNPRLPILIVGDDKGVVMSYKLSPNLRSSLKGFTDLDRSKFVASEIDRMEKVLKLAKTPEGNKEKTS